MSDPKPKEGDPKPPTKDPKPQTPPSQPQTPVANPPEGPPGVKLNVKINPDAVQRMQKRLDDLERVANERQKQIDQLEADKLQTAEQLEEREAQLTAIALERFNSEKQVLLDAAKERGLDEEKLEQINQRIQKPEDLESTKYFIDLLLEGIKKGGTPPFTVASRLNFIYLNRIYQIKNLQHKKFH